MATCPECDSDIDVDEYDVDKGDLISCPECGTNLEVVNLFRSSSRPRLTRMTKTRMTTTSRKTTTSMTTMTTTKTRTRTKRRVGTGTNDHWHRPGR